MKKIMGTLLGILLLMLASTVSVNAAIKIQCGDNVYGVLDSSGKLTIQGTGDMWDSQKFQSRFYKYYQDKIITVDIKQGVTSIGSNSFEDCDQIRYVTIGESVKRIGTNAFYDCGGLFEIDIPGNVQVIGDNAFYYSKLTKCTLHSGLQVIGNNAFADTRLESINIPEGVRIVGERAFQYSNLKNVTINENTGTIKKNAFPSVVATIKADKITIAPDAFGTGSIFIVDWESDGAKYAKDYNIQIRYNQYKAYLIFHADGGVVDTEKIEVLTGQRFGALPIPRRAGYGFLGWYLENGRQITEKTSLYPKKQCDGKEYDLYAHWKAILVGSSAKPVVTNRYYREVVVKIKGGSGATGYQVYYSKKPKRESGKSVFTSSKTPVLKNLKKNSTYYVWVRAYQNDSANKKVYGNWSSAAKVKITR